MPILSEKNTGPYRRVLSKLGFAYESATIFLPDTGNISTFDHAGNIKPSGDTVFVYMGGAGPNGGEIDAGFQYSQAKNDWALLMRVAGFDDANAKVTMADGTTKFAPRFLAGQEVTLEFEVISTDVIEIRARGDLVDGQKDVLQTIRRDISKFPDTPENKKKGRVDGPTNFGWNPTGAKNRLKRVTSIAQHENPDVIESGSFVRGVKWSQCEIGKTRADAKAWSSESFLKERSENFTNHPNKTIVQVAFVSASEETVAIVL